MSENNIDRLIQELEHLGWFIGNYSDVATALHNAGLALEQGWCFDMETAPRDGTPVLLARKSTGDQYEKRRSWGSVVQARWRGSFWHIAQKAQYGQDESFIGWRPLPTPPKGESHE